MSYDNIFERDLKPFLRNFLYLLISMPLGIVYFTFAIVGISFGFGLSIVYIGIPIIASMLICINKIVDFEKITATKILNTNINIDREIINLNSNDKIIKRIIGVIKNSKNWKNFCYCIVKLPISIIHFTIVTCLPILSIGLVSHPFIFIVTKKAGIDIFRNNIGLGELLGLQLSNGEKSFLYFILGLGVTFITIKTINTLAEKWAEFTLKF